MSAQSPTGPDPEDAKAKARKSREIRDAARVARWRNFHLDAGRRTRTAWAWIPRLRLVVMASSLVAVAACLASLAAVYSRPHAMVFLSLDDGTIACAPLSDARGQPVRRPRAQQAVCDRLVPPVGFAQEPAAPRTGSQ